MNISLLFLFSLNIGMWHWSLIIEESSFHLIYDDILYVVSYQGIQRLHHIRFCVHFFSFVVTVVCNYVTEQMWVVFSSFLFLLLLSLYVKFNKEIRFALSCLEYWTRNLFFFLNSTVRCFHLLLSCYKNCTVLVTTCPKYCWENLCTCQSYCWKSILNKVWFIL